MRFLFLFFFVTSEILANFGIAAVTENEPSSLVEGVSVITGDFCMHNELYTIQAAEPIPISRTYISAGVMFNGYEHTAATFFPQQDIILISERYGTPIFYFMKKTRKGGLGELFYGDLEKKEKHKPYVYTAEEFIQATLGVTNTASGDLSARTHIKNHRVVFDPKENPEGKSFLFYASDGTLRHYGKMTPGIEMELPHSGIFKNQTYYANYNYFLEKEELPNGHVLEYVRQGTALTEIRSTNRSGSKIFASVHIGRTPSGGSLYSTMDGLQGGVDLRFVEIAKQALPQRMFSPNQPDVFLHWTAKQMVVNGNLKQQGFLSTISRGDKKVLYISYNMGDIHTKPKVSELKSPVGKDANLLTTHRFIYHDNSTDVFDIDGNKTT